MSRSIIHVDMDAFYASIEQRDNPSLRGKPVIIGGRPRTRGVVSTCSYEARKFGVRSAMPLGQARRLCPEGIFLPVNMAKYRRVSARFLAILKKFTPLVEAHSLDEAFLDVTQSQRLFGSPAQIARLIKAEILEKLYLSVSIGVGPNKFLAKLASELEKPNGLVIIKETDVQKILNPLPVERIWGVGEHTKAKLKGFGIETIGELARFSSKTLEASLGKVGLKLRSLAQGIDASEVVPFTPPKSMGHEITFDRDLTDPNQIKATIGQLCEAVGRRLRRAGYVGSRVILKIRSGEFKTISRSLTLSDPTDLDRTIYQGALRILARTQVPSRVRLVGVTVSELQKITDVRQLSLFEEEARKGERMTEAVDRIRDRYGQGVIGRGEG